MNIIGIDNGYKYTKVIGENIRRIFQSAYVTNDKVISGTAHINIDDKDYYVGSGITVANPDKTDHEINKICTLTALSMYGNDDYFLVVGLPIGQYKTQKDKFKSAILNYSNSKVIYHGTQLDIKIRDVTVYPQCAAIVYTLNRNSGKFILVDIGAYTIDVALIEMVNGLPTVVKYDTWFKGVTTLYSKITEEINNRFSLSLDPQDAEQIILDGFITIGGKKTDASFICKIIDIYLEETYYLLDLNYKSQTTDIYLSGGGAVNMYASFKKRYPQTELTNDAQFANANGYYRIGQQKYYKYTNSYGGK